MRQAYHIRLAGLTDHSARMCERAGKALSNATLAHQVAHVWRDSDLELAARMETEDDLMDDMNQEMFADHAVAVAQHVVFLITGKTDNPTQAPPAAEPGPAIGPEDTSPALERHR